MTEEQKLMIEDCKKRESKVSDWEQKFISHMRSIERCGRSLTTSQIEILDQIWEKATADG